MLQSRQYVAILFHLMLIITPGSSISTQAQLRARTVMPRSEEVKRMLRLEEMVDAPEPPSVGGEEAQRAEMPANLNQIEIVLPRRAPKVYEAPRVDPDNRLPRMQIPMTYDKLFIAIIVGLSVGLVGGLFIKTAPDPDPTIKLDSYALCGLVGAVSSLLVNCPGRRTLFGYEGPLIGGLAGLFNALLQSQDHGPINPTITLLKTLLSIIAGVATRWAAGDPYYDFHARLFQKRIDGERFQLIMQTKIDSARKAAKAKAREQMIAEGV